MIREARAQYFPTVTASPSIVQSRQSATPLEKRWGLPRSPADPLRSTIAVDLTWEPDLWGRVRNTVRANINAAQASAADLENVRFTEQAEFAINYYELRTKTL